MEQDRKLGSVLEEVLEDIVHGMDFSMTTKSLSESLLTEIRSRLGSDASYSLGKKEEDYLGNVLREVDALLLETEALHLLVRKIHESTDPAIREKFKDRRISRRKVIEDFISSL